MNKMLMKNKKTGWEYLTNKTEISVTQPIGKITMTIERNQYLGRDKIRISRKNLLEAFDLLNKKSQRIRWKRKDKLTSNNGSGKVENEV